MNEVETEELLGQLGELPVEEEESLPREMLERYRSGRLAPREVEEVERRLAASTGARAALAELGGLSPAALHSPPPRVRAVVLARIEAETATTPAGEPRRSWATWPRSRWWAAATLAFALVGSCLLLPRLGTDRRGHLAEVALPEYEVSARGLAAERSLAAAGSTIEALADTRVVLEVAAAGQGAPDAVLALFHRQGSRLVPVPLAGAVTLEEGPGAWRVSAPARALVGGEAGPQELWVVVGWRRTMPSEAEVAGASSGEALAAAGRRVFPVRIDLKPDPAPGASPGDLP